MSDLGNLRTFVAAARLGSFAAAARQLDLSPAMVGRRIQALEQHYGARLIERTTRSQRLTALGEDFLAQAQELLDAEDRLAELTRTEPGELSGRIRISGPTTFGSKKLAAIIAAFVAKNPLVVCEMALADRRVDLVAEGFDLAVRVGNLRPSGLIARRIGTYHFVCCAAPAHITRYGMPKTPADLVGVPCVLNLILIPRNHWSFVSPAGDEVVAMVNGAIEIDNGEAQLAAALAGGGVVYLPRDMAEDALRDGRLVQLLPDWSIPTLPIHIIHPSRKQVPRRVTAFIDAVAEAMRASPLPSGERSARSAG